MFCTSIRVKLSGWRIVFNDIESSKQNLKNCFQIKKFRSFFVMLWRGTIPGIVAFETLTEEEPFRIFHQKKILRGYRLYQQHQLTTTTALCLSKELLWSRPLVRAKKWIVSTNLNFILDLLDADAHKNTLSKLRHIFVCIT